MIFFLRLNIENKDNFALSELRYSLIALYWFAFSIYETKLIFKSLSSGVQKSGITSWKWLYLTSCCHFYSMMLINERSVFKKTIDWCSRVNYVDEIQQSRSFSAGQYPVNDRAECVTEVTTPSCTLHRCQHLIMPQVKLTRLDGTKKE